MNTSDPSRAALKPLNQYSADEQLFLLKSICNRIFIGRNISMSEEQILAELSKIDSLFATRESYE